MVITDRTSTEYTRDFVVTEYFVRLRYRGRYYSAFHEEMYRYSVPSTRTEYEYRVSVTVPGLGDLLHQTVGGFRITKADEEQRELLH